MGQSTLTDFSPTDEAVVEFGYASQNADELTIRVGDVLTELRRTEPGWLSGRLRGQVGVFPDNFVKIRHSNAPAAGAKESQVPCAGKTPSAAGHETAASRTASKTSTHSPSGSVLFSCRVVFAYQPQNGDELQLRVGDVLHVLQEVEAGWWKGSLGGKVGVFPSNFVEKCAPSDVSHSACDGLIRKSSVTSLGSSLLRDKTRPSAATSGRSDHGPSVCKDPARSTSDGNLAVDKEPAPKLPPKPVREQCRVLFAYQQQNEDELALAVGDIVTIVAKDSEDKGWWRGELAGRVGVFPDNFVEIIRPAEKQKALQAPPSAPNIGSASAPKLSDTVSTSETASNSGTSAMRLTPSVPIGFVPAAATAKPPPPPVSGSRRAAAPAAEAAVSPLAARHGPCSLPQPLATCRVSDGSSASRSGSSTPELSTEVLDSVERGAERLSHITASRARIPGRRPPQSRNSHCAPATASVTPVSSAVSSATHSQNGRLSNGDSKDSVTVNTSPWQRELQRNNHASASKTNGLCLSVTGQQAGTSGRRSTHITSPTRSAAATLPEPVHQSAAPPTASRSPHSSQPCPPWSLKLKPVGGGDKNGQTGCTDDSTKSSVHQPAVVSSTQSPVTTTSSPAAAVAAAATTSNSDLGRQLHSLQQECAQLHRQLEQQTKSAHAEVAALRGEFKRQMRSVLDELDAEKKERVAMQVQLDRLDKLVKDMNFTV